MHSEKTCHRCGSDKNTWECKNCVAAKAFCIAQGAYMSRLLAGDSDKCGQCKFRGPLMYDQWGPVMTCRRNSPVDNHKWPAVGYFEWCGQYVKGPLNGTR